MDETRIKLAEQVQDLSRQLAAAEDARAKLSGELGTATEQLQRAALINGERSWNWNEWRDRIYALAVEKGWHETSVPWPVSMALIVTEFAEAVEAFRLRDIESWHDDGKPEGLASELADVVIRCLDVAVAHNRDMEGSWPLALSAREHLLGLEVAAARKRESPTAPVEAIWKAICDFGAWGCVSNDRIPLSHAILGAMRVAMESGIDIRAAIVEKHAYNATRTRRHGAKLI